MSDKKDDRIAALWIALPLMSVSEDFKAAMAAAGWFSEEMPPKDHPAYRAMVDFQIPMSPRNVAAIDRAADASVLPRPRFLEKYR